MLDPQYSKARIHGLHLAVIAALIGPSVSIAANVAIPNPNFNTDLSAWVANGGASLVQRDITYGGVTRKMGCFNNPSSVDADGYYQGPAIQVSFSPLKANTKYKFSFLAVSNGTSNNKPVDVRSTVREAYDASNAYRARPYIEKIQPANGVQSFIFTTPLKDARAAGALKEKDGVLVSNSNIYFMAKPESSNAGLGGELCVDDIVLEELENNTPDVKNPDYTKDPRKVTAVQVNQVGYGIAADKKAIIANAKVGDAWSLLENGAKVTGVGLTLTALGAIDTDSGDRTHVADFSSVTGNPTAAYVVRLTPADNSAPIDSAPFKIDPKQYATLKKDALSFFYAQRSTEDINLLKYPHYRAWVVNDRPAGHNVDLAKCWRVGTEAWNQTADGWGNTFWSGCTWPTNVTVPGMDRLNTQTGQLDVSGGWYDAADHGKYVVNGGVALWTLQNQIERLVKREPTQNTILNAAIPDGALMYPTTPHWIPQVGIPPVVKTDGLSDLLNEARYEMEWMLKMQVPGLTTAESGGAVGASTWMTLPVGYQSGNDVDTAKVILKDGVGTRLDTSNNIAWPTIGIALTPSATPLNVSGMAFHSIHDRYWTGVPQYPHSYTLSANGANVPAEEKRTLMYPTTAATLNLAATAAQCYRIWKGIDSTFANRCLDAATRAYNAAKANSRIFVVEFSDARNLPLQAQFAGGGAYGDYRVKDEFYWAGMELYLANLAKGDTLSADTYFTDANARMAVGMTEDGTTASKTYSTCTREDGTASSVFPIRCYDWASAFDWQNTAALGTLSLATVLPSNLSAAQVTAIKNSVTIAADSYVTNRTLQGYLFPKKPTGTVTNQYGPLTDFKDDYKWGSNGNLLNRAIVLGVAYDLSANTKYLQASADAMHYILGRNALGKSYVSGYGSNSLLNPHHRVWGKSGNVEYPAVPAGVLAGGPASGEFTGMFIGGANEGGDHFWNITRNTLGCKMLAADNTVVTVTPANTTLLTGAAPKNMALPKTTTVNRYHGQRCYSDDIRSFATNEVAVNWNAPLFWVSQFLDGTSGQ